GERFEAMHWHVLHVDDGNDLDALQQAIQAGIDETERPSLVIVRTTIGYGSPKRAGTWQAHGNPLGAEEVEATKRNLGWPATETFYIPPQTATLFRQAIGRGESLEEGWQRRFDAYAADYPDLAAQFRRTLAGELPPCWDCDLPVFEAGAKMATRAAGGAVINALGKTLPELIGGSADLNPSTDTALKDDGDFESPANLAPDRQGSVGGPWGYTGRNIFY